MTWLRSRWASKSTIWIEWGQTKWPSNLCELLLCRSYQAVYACFYFGYGWSLSTSQAQRLTGAISLTNVWASDYFIPHLEDLVNTLCEFLVLLLFILWSTWGEIWITSSWCPLRRTLTLWIHLQWFCWSLTGLRQAYKYLIISLLAVTSRHIPCFARWWTC